MHSIGKRRNPSDPIKADSGVRSPIRYISCTFIQVSIDPSLSPLFPPNSFPFRRTCQRQWTGLSKKFPRKLLRRPHTRATRRTLSALLRCLGRNLFDALSSGVCIYYWYQYYIKNYRGADTSIYMLYIVAVITSSS